MCGYPHYFLCTDETQRAATGQRPGRLFFILIEKEWASGEIWLHGAKPLHNIAPLLLSKTTYHVAEHLGRISKEGFIIRTHAGLTAIMTIDKPVKLVEHALEFLYREPCVGFGSLLKSSFVVSKTTRVFFIG